MDEPRSDKGDESEINQFQREAVPDLMQQRFDGDDDVWTGRPTLGRLHDAPHRRLLCFVERRNVANRLVRFDCLDIHALLQRSRKAEVYHLRYRQTILKMRLGVFEQRPEPRENVPREIAR